jgi:mannose-6-phosphate isomerase-like protein (cupin superfamily)
VNHKCDEIYYVISGTWTVHQETGDYIIKEGDAFFFEKEKRYRVEGENLKLTITNHPAWFLQQYENI